MKWVKLIGGRFLDFIIMGAVVVLICVGLVLSSDKYHDSTREKALKALESDRTLESRKYYYDEEIRQMIESELLGLKFFEKRGGLNLSQVKKRQKYVKLKRQLNRVDILYDSITPALIIALGLFGVISVLGIVFRREGLTQREGFVRVWVGVPKYFAGYLRKSNTGGE